MFQRIATVARNTFVESIRQPIFLVMLLSTIGLLTLNPALCSYTFEDDDKLLRSVGLSTLFIAGLLLAAFTATRVLADEIRRRTVLAVVSKPVSRPVFLVGKYLGVVGSMLVALWIWSLTFLLALRHGVLSTVRDPYHEPVLLFGFGTLIVALLLALAANYFRAWNFGSTLTGLLALLLPLAALPAFSHDARWGPTELSGAFDPQTLLALLLAAEALAILCAIAVAASTRLGELLTLAVCSLFFFLGMTGEYFLSRYGSESWWANLFELALPNLQLTWLDEALLREQAVSGDYVLLVSGYAVLYVVAALGVGTALFQARDVG